MLLRRYSTTEARSTVSELFDLLDDRARSMAITEQESGVPLNTDNLRDLLLIQLVHAMMHDDLDQMQMLAGVIKEFSPPVTLEQDNENNDH